MLHPHHHQPLQGPHHPCHPLRRRCWPHLKEIFKVRGMIGKGERLNWQRMLAFLDWIFRLYRYAFVVSFNSSSSVIPFVQYVSSLLVTEGATWSLNAKKISKPSWLSQILAFTEHQEQCKWEYRSCTFNLIEVDIRYGTMKQKIHR